MAAAYFLRRAGMAVTVFEKNDALGGVVRHVIPEFRIPGTSINKDAALLEKMGVEVRLNTEVKDTAALKAEGFTTVILAVGASEPGVLRLEQGEAKNALEFLADFKANDGKLDIGKNHNFTDQFSILKFNRRKEFHEFYAVLYCHYQLFFVCRHIAFCSSVYSDRSCW